MSGAAPRSTRQIDWNKPVGQVYDLIRGANPAPGAWTTLNGEKVSIYDSARAAGDGISRRVMDVSDDGRHGAVHRRAYPGETGQAGRRRQAGSLGLGRIGRAECWR